MGKSMDFETRKTSRLNETRNKVVGYHWDDTAAGRWAVILR